MSSNGTLSMNERKQSSAIAYGCVFCGARARPLSKEKDTYAKACVNGTADLLFRRFFIYDGRERASDAYGAGTYEKPAFLEAVVFFQDVAF